MRSRRSAPTGSSSRRTPQRAVAQRPGGIGATFEGVFRNHTIMPDGSAPDSAYFSVIADEWPAVKAALAARLDR